MPKIVTFLLAFMLLLFGGCASGSPSSDGGGQTADAQAAADSGAADAEQPVDSGTGDTGSIDAGSTFPPETQAPFFEKGLIIPPNALPCVPASTGVPQDTCNHHGSSIAVLSDGTIAVSWFHGVEEGSVDSRLVWSRFLPGAAAWTAPAVLFDDPGRPEGNSALWVSEKGVLFCFFVTIFGTSWDDDKVRLITSGDGGLSWTDPIFLWDQRCQEVRHQPLRLDNGDLLLPLNNGCLSIPTFMRSRDDFATWTTEEDDSGAFIMDHVEMSQPALAQLPDGRLTAVLRDGTISRRIKRMVSADHGHTWTKGVALNLPNASTSITQAGLLDGQVVVVFDNAPGFRFPLAAALSVDGGETFAAVRDLDAGCDRANCEYSYPSIAQSRRDGTIWVSYTHNRETIGWVHFNEAWLAQGGGASNFWCLPGERCRDGGCFLECAADGDCKAGACRDGACRAACANSVDCAARELCGANGLCAPDPAGRADALCSGDGT